MDRTVSEGQSIVSAGVLTNDPVSLMGKLRCVYEHHGRSRSYGYKKLFWVVNEAKSCLEVYKNDQVYVPMDIIKAVELRSVSYAADKQNRFYVMVVHLRRDYDVKFRMNSPEERDQWANAVNRLISTFSTTNQRKTTLGQVIRHIAMASRQLGIQIAVDTGMILTEISDDLLQYVVEAVDTALTTIAVITHSGERDVPRHYTLEVRHISDSTEWDQRSTYDPTSRSVLLQVGLYRDVLNHVQFCCTEPDDVLLMMQSSVYRNPTIEGWLDNDVGCVRGRRALEQYVNSDRPLTISLQFTQNVRDSAKVETYLRRFVNESFFISLIAVLKETVESMVLCVERLRGSLPSSFGNAATAGSGGGSGVIRSQSMVPRSQSSASFFDGNLSGAASPTRLPPACGPGTSSPMGTGSFRRGFVAGGSGVVTASAHSRSRSGGGAQSGLNATAVAGTGGSGHGHVHNRTASTAGTFYRGNTTILATSFGGPSTNVESNSPSTNPLAKMALALLLDTVDGLSVLLEAFRVDSCSGAPSVVVGYSPTYGKKYRSAMLLEAKFAELFPESNLATFTTRFTSLKDQLHQLSLRVLLTQLLQTLKSRLNAVCGRKQIRVVIHWPTLFSALRRVTGRSGDGHARSELLRIVASVMDAYESRLLQLVQQLNDIPFSPNESGSVSDGSATFFSVFCSCVWSIHVVFAPVSADDLQTPDSFDPPPPTVNGGVMTDTIFVVPEAILPRASAFLFTRSDSAFSVTVRTAATSGSSPLVPDIVLLPAVAKLAKWCAGYFRHRENMIPYDAAMMHAGAESDSDSDKDTNATEAAIDLDFGDAVATERSAENTFLSMQRVVNSVYDQQGPSVDLKISVEDIRRAACSLQNALSRKHRISKHDTEHILSANLHKLRRMYTTTLDDEVGSRFLTEAEAETLLRAFCEYEENEKDIVANLRSGAVSDRVQAITGCEPNTPSSHVGQYDFVAIARVALNDLLPLEAQVSRRAWRAGFIFGLTNTGKSLITNCLHGISRPTVATVGLARQVVSFKQWVLALHELGGRDSFRRNWQFYARRLGKVEFLIFVLDSINHRAFGEAHQYLREVASEYPTKPLLIILNNYHEHPIPMPIEQLLSGISLDKIRKENPDRKVIVCTTDLTIVHSVNRTVPAKLYKGMEQLCDALLARSAGDKIPAVPKPDPAPLDPEDPPRSSPGSLPGSNYHQRLRSTGGGNNFQRASVAPSHGSPHMFGTAASASATPLVHNATRSAFASSNRLDDHLRNRGDPPTSRAADETRTRGGPADSSPPAYQLTVPSRATGVAASRLMPKSNPLHSEQPSELSVRSLLQADVSDSDGYPVSWHAHKGSLSGISGADTLAWQTSHIHPMDITNDENAANGDAAQSLARSHDSESPRHPSKTLLSNKTEHDAAAQRAPHRPLGKSASSSVALFMSSSTSASVSSLHNVSLRHPVDTIQQSAGQGGASLAPTRAVASGGVSRGNADLRTRRDRLQSISVTQAPESFAAAIPAPSVFAEQPESCGTADVAASSAKQQTQQAERPHTGKLPSPSHSPSSASRKEPSIRIPPPLDGPLENSSFCLCTPAPVLEDRPSVVRQRSATVAPLTSPSPTRDNRYQPLYFTMNANV